MALTEGQKKAAEKNRKYWEQRELEQKKHYITEEKEYQKHLNKIYEDMIDNVQKEIEAFYGKYAKAEGITIAEAKKRVSKLDIEAYERKAKRYVENKDFSKEANEEMRLYNATMKINRLEMLKANIGLELISGHEELQKYMEGILQGRTEDELKRQAGILGETIKDNAKAAHAIVNASFHNAKYSDRIWMHQDILKAELSKQLQSGLIQGKNPRVLAKNIRQKFDVSKASAETLMRTELARVQTEAQKLSFERNGFEQYTFLALGDACGICKELNDKHFYVKDMMPGTNAPPMHPNCRCSTSAYEDSEEYEAWLDYLDKGGESVNFRKEFEINYNDDKSQEFKPVKLDNNKKIEMNMYTKKIIATKALGFDKDIYVSDSSHVNVKPKQLAYINARVDKALSLMNVPKDYELPKIIIVDDTEIGKGAAASYTAKDNILRISHRINSRKSLVEFAKGCACEKNQNSLIVHELFHWMDAQEYKKKYNTTDGYFEHINEVSKKKIALLQKKGYNISKVSDYAVKKMLEGRYDEVWTEYRTKNILDR